MENMMGDWEQKGLINELTQGRELAKQLQHHLHLNLPSSSLETRETLVQKILASYEKALSIATCSNSAMPPDQTFTAAPVRLVDSPPSLAGSPRSDDSDREFKELEQRDLYKRRKTMPRWTQHVRVSHGTALEGPLDDGFSWRKYGQKDILGARYPRGYYRCTHRNVQGCLATKQVQRTDEDPSIYEITYRGKHSCTQASQEQTTTNAHQHQSPELLQNFKKGLKVVVTQDLEHHQHYPSFPFPSKSQDNLFSIINNQVAPPNGFNLAASQNGAGDVHGNVNFQSSSDHQPEIISLSATPTSSTADSATVSFGIPFGTVEFDPNFTFDQPGGFFS